MSAKPAQAGSRVPATTRAAWTGRTSFAAIGLRPRPALIAPLMNEQPAAAAWTRPGRGVHTVETRVLRAATRGAAAPADLYVAVDERAANVRCTAPSGPPLSHWEGTGSAFEVSAFGIIGILMDMLNRGPGLHSPAALRRPRQSWKATVIFDFTGKAATLSGPRRCT